MVEDIDDFTDNNVQTLVQCLVDWSFDEKHKNIRPIVNWFMKQKAELSIENVFKSVKYKTIKKWINEYKDENGEIDSDLEQIKPLFQNLENTLLQV